MSIWSSIGSWFKKVGGQVMKGLNLAIGAGLTDMLVAEALKQVKLASDKYVDNAARREWVVTQLKKAKVPESIARIAVELAFQIYRDELDKLDGLEVV